MSAQRFDPAARLVGVANREAPVPLRRPISQPGVGGHGHLFAEDVEDDTQRVVRRFVEPLEDGRAHLERVFAAVVHPRKGVCRTARLDVALEHAHAVAVLGRQRAAREATHAAADDHHVVLTLFAALPVARARVGGLLILGLKRHVVGEGHHLVARRVLCLRDVGRLHDHAQCRARARHSRCGRQRIAREQSRRAERQQRHGAA
mmetsp:Transcript_9349/g.30998  ORF Transcript_9349/g.30998 Transcript_9349/m.30998 type:complete len:204 (+) Transcript_9349:1774-2385(+)